MIFSPLVMNPGTRFCGYLIVYSETYFCKLERVAPDSAFLGYGIYGNQSQSQVANPFKNPLQRGLIWEVTREEGIALLQVGNIQAIEPARQRAIQMAFDSDLIEGKFVHSSPVSRRIPI